MKFVRINDRIFAKSMRVIGPTGEQLGVFTKDLAIRKAQEYELDLVEVAPEAKPPVCRIMDFQKYRYEQDKKEREARKHQKQAQLKEIRISPRIDDHDYQTKVNHVKEFLEKKHQVRIRMLYRGREMAHKEVGDKLLAQLIKDIEGVGRVEKPALTQGRMVFLILGPK